MHATSESLHPWPLEVMVVPHPTTGLAMVRITRMTLRLCAHLVCLSVN
jgi:hypothetical protein